MALADTWGPAADLIRAALVRSRPNAATIADGVTSAQGKYAAGDMTGALETTWYLIGVLDARQAELLSAVRQLVDAIDGIIVPAIVPMDPDEIWKAWTDAKDEGDQVGKVLLDVSMARGPGG